MQDTYGYYLSSTKREGNDQIGGFGLGSKSPFAYTDSFFVNTVYNGVRTKYLCYIDSTQLGAISEMSKEETTAGNSTEIIVPAKSEYDKQSFQNAILRQLGYFRNLKFIGFVPPEREVLYEDEDCIVLKTPPIMDAHIVLGNVAYNIDFKACALDYYGSGVMNCGIGLKFKIGDLQPTLSREDIFWSDTVKQKVLKKLAIVRGVIRKQIELELEGEKDYARWWANVMLGKTKSFPRQWQFSGMKSAAKMNTSQGPIEVHNRYSDWFSGHNVRVVTKFASWRRSKKTPDPEYSTGTPNVNQLAELPVYQLSNNLSARTCVFLFKTHPTGFLVVSHLSKPTESGVLPYYEATKDWVSTLPKYEDIVVPDTEPATVDDKSAYKALVKQRKLEGKFTAKSMNSGFIIVKGVPSFTYNMYESKFQDHTKTTIVYGFQEDHDKLCKVASMLLQSGPKWDDFVAGKLLILKVGKQYTKQFAMMPNAHYAENVLQLKTPLNEAFASIATALRLKPDLHAYHILDFFGHINVDMQSKYKTLHRFIERETKGLIYTSSEVQKDIVLLCKHNLNKEMENTFEEIVDYFKGAELLKSINFGWGYAHYSPTTYLTEYVKANTEAIKAYLVHNNKEVDGVPVVNIKLQSAVIVSSKTSIENKLHKLRVCQKD